MLGKPRLLERVGQVRDAAAAALGETWNHARFQAERTGSNSSLQVGACPRRSTERSSCSARQAAGEQAYPSADYDLAVAFFQLARVSEAAGGSEQSLPRLDEARKRFEAIERDRPGRGAERMASPA